MAKDGPRIFTLDIELLPMEVYAWRLYDDHAGPAQIKEDWSVLSWALKEIGSTTVHYRDVRGQTDKRDDKRILKILYSLLEDADILVGHNINAFDLKKLFYRFLVHGMKPLEIKTLDTLTMARRKFGASSNALGFLDKLTSMRKSPSRKFIGQELWTECLRGNLAAFRECELYNKKDVLVTEELYEKISPWVKTYNPGHYVVDHDPICTCGSKEFIKKGFQLSPASKRQRYKCKECGKAWYGQENLLSIQKRKSLFK